MFLILPKYNSKQQISLAEWIWWANWKFDFIINSNAVSLFLLQLSLACNPAFYFNIVKRLWRHASFSFTCFCYYRKPNPNNDNICPLQSTCFQQRFHDWFSVLRFNSDNHHYCLTPTNSVFCQIDTNFSNPVQARTLKTDLLQFNINFV